MKITLWERQVKNERGEFVYEFNHISDGFDDAEEPAPKFPNQQSWLKSNWRKTEASLINGVVVK